MVKVQMCGTVPNGLTLYTISLGCVSFIVSLLSCGNYVSFVSSRFLGLVLKRVIMAFPGSYSLIFFIRRTKTLI